MMTWGLVLVLPLTFPRPHYFITSACCQITLTMTNLDTRGRLAGTKKRGPTAAYLTQQTTVGQSIRQDDQS